MNPNISLEFFPPRSVSQQTQFWETLHKLESINPSYISMTWGALGSSSKASLEILEPLLKHSPTPVTAHLTCSGQSEAQVRESIKTLEKLGIQRFLALRGDAVSSQKSEDCLHHASDLVSILAEQPDRHISVAAYPEAHPESADRYHDLLWLRNKLNAGACSAITQFFFEADTFLRFRDSAVACGITQKLVPGILPIHDIAKVQSFSEKCAAYVPSALVERFSFATTAAEKTDLAVEHSVQLCQQLQREGVNDFHLYTLNQSELSLKIHRAWLGNSSDSYAAA